MKWMIMLCSAIAVVCIWTVLGPAPLWAGEVQERYEHVFAPKKAQHKTFFIDTSPAPTRKELILTLVVEELTTAGRQCSGKLDVKYLVDEGEPYTAFLTITGCTTHKIVAQGRVRYIDFRFTNSEESPAKGRFNLSFSWRDAN